MQVITNHGCINRVSLRSSTGAGTTQATGMPIVPIRVNAKDSSSLVDVYAFLDSGSNTTFSTKRLINRLGMQGDEDPLSLTTMNNENVQSDCTIVNLMVYDLQEKNSIELPSVYSCQKLPVTAKDIPPQADVSQCQCLKGIKLPSRPVNR